MAKGFSNNAKGFFITGTDTGIGKTVASAALIRHFTSQGNKVAGLKPIASGFTQVDGRWQNDDVAMISSAANVVLPPERINRYGFEPAIAPHIAAANENVKIDLSLIQEDLNFARQRADRVIVEGVGGWLVPLSESSELTIESLAIKLALPVVLVVGLRLGCLNHALLTAQAISASGVPFLGWVANHMEPDFSHLQQNLASLEATMPVPRLFDVPYCPGNPAGATIQNIDPRLR